MSSKVKQANFRLPLEYMALIDDFARREDITKATVITRALDCMQASYDSGHGGMPVTGGSSAGGASDAELEDLRAKLKKAEERATDAERALQSAEDRLRDAQRQRDEAENRARNAQSDLATAQAQSAHVSSNDSRRTEAAEEEVERLRALVAKQAATLEEKIRALASKEVGYDDQARTLANKDAEISSRDAIIADRDRQITDLRSQLSEAQARVQLSNANSMSLSPVTFDASTFTEESPVGAISMLNMLNGVMAAFKQQVKDARILGEQEGRKAQQHEFEDVINKARNDGYRDAMTYLDDRATTAVNLVRVKNVRVSRTWASSSVVAISTSTLPKSTKLRSGNAGHVCLRVRRRIFLRSQTHYFANTVTGTSCSSAGMKATSCSENATAIWRQSLPSCGR